MKHYLKYVFWAAAVQVVLCVFFVVLGNLFPSMDSVAHGFVGLYNPVLNLLARLAGGGESSMIGVPLIGIPLGILLYSIIIGLVMWLVTKSRAHR